MTTYINVINPDATYAVAGDEWQFTTLDEMFAFTAKLEGQGRSFKCIIDPPDKKDDLRVILL